MLRPQIQRNPQWAWLWNPRSQGGVYYRWRLWEILTGSDRRRGQRVGYGMKPSGEVLFEGQSQWIAPEETLKFEYTTNLEEFVSDEDYNSSDEEDDEQGRGGLARRHNDHNIAGPDNVMDTNDGLGYLNPLGKAKLVHLLSRLPTSNARLRKGDVARITGFAIEHAGAGADEVAALVTRNVVQPLSQRNRQKQKSENESGDSENEENIDADATKDVSPSSLIGLYIISDILSASASAGVRHAWRYRSLFETSLRRQNVFERLGRYEKEMKWGKLKAEKWKRSVQVVLGLWEGWSVWTGEVQEEFANGFLNPPALTGERMEEEDEGGKEEMERTRFKASTKWKSVDASAAEGGGGKVGSEDVDGRAVVDDDDDVDGMLMDEEEEVVDEDVDGVPMADSSDEEMVDAPTDAAEEALESGPQPPPPPPAEERKNEPPPPVSMGRQRPRAMDMFADEESD
jgi:U2-associated protein SR140